MVDIRTLLTSLFTDDYVFFNGDSVIVDTCSLSLSDLEVKADLYLEKSLVREAIIGAQQRVGTHSARRCGNQILRELGL